MEQSQGNLELKESLNQVSKAIFNNNVTFIEQILQEFEGKFGRKYYKYHPLYNAILECYMRASLVYKAKSFLDSLLESGFKPSILTFKIMIDGFLHHNDAKNATNIMSSMDQFNIKPTSSIYNDWIAYYLRDEQLEKAKEICHVMMEKRIKPLRKTYLEFILFFLKSGDLVSVQRIKESLMEEAGQSLDITFYNAMLKILFKRKAISEINALLQEMKINNIKYSINTYNRLIEGYASVNDFDKVQFFLDEMEKTGHTPTIITFNRLLSGYCHNFNMKQTREILDKMNQLGLEFNAFTYAALFKGLLLQKKPGEAASMLITMESNKIVVPVELYSDLLKLCCDENRGSLVHLLQRQMNRSSVMFNLISYNILIKYYLRHRQYAMVDELMLELQKKQNLAPNIHIVTTLLNHFIEVMDIDRIGKCLEYLKNSNLELTGSIYSVLMKAFYVHIKYLEGGYIYRANLVYSNDENIQKGMKLENENETGNRIEMKMKKDNHSNEFNSKINMENRKITIKPHLKPVNMEELGKKFTNEFKIPFRPTIHMFNELLLSLILSSHLNRVQECYGEIIRARIRPNLTTFTFLIKAYLFDGKIEMARTTLKEMRKLDLKPTVTQCAFIFHAYCRQLLIVEAEVFMQELVSFHRIELNHVFYASLIYAYYRIKDYNGLLRIFSLLEMAGLKPDTETCNYCLLALFESGDQKGALELFERMIKQEIKRNHYTYGIITEKLLDRHEVDRVGEKLQDSKLAGNSIDANPYNRLLRYYFEGSQLAKIDSTLMEMMNNCIKFSHETMPYIHYSFHRSLKQQSNKDTLEFAIKLYKKLMIDFDELPMDSSTILLKLLKDELNRLNLIDFQRDLEKFLEKDQEEMEMEIKNQNENKEERRKNEGGLARLKKKMLETPLLDQRNQENHEQQYQQHIKYTFGELNEQEFNKFKKELELYSKNTVYRFVKPFHSSSSSNSHSPSILSSPNENNELEEKEK